MAEPTLTTKFHDLARESQALSLELERGQASTPMADHFSLLAEEQASAPFTITLVSLNAQARVEVLAWLLGEDHSSVSMRVGALPGLMEVHLSETGYWLERRDGQRHEFDSLQGFLGALESGEIPGTNEGEPVRVSLAAPTDAQGACLLLPDSLQTVRDVPGLSGRLIVRTHLLLVAGPAAGQMPGQEEAEVVGNLAQGIGVVLPVMAETSQAQQGAPWSRGFSVMSGVLALAPIDIAGVATASPFSGPIGSLRDTLRLSSSSRRLSLAIEALRERHTQDMRQIQFRRSRDEQSSRPESASTDPAIRRSLELARLQIQQDVAALVKSSAESSRRSLLPDGVVTYALQQQLDSLQPEDVTQEPGAKSVKLSLSSGFQTHLQRALRKALKDELTQDLVTLRDGATALRQDLEKQLESGGIGPVSLAVSAPSESDIWPRLSEIVSVELRYRGEMPRRGLLQRLGEGRRMVFAVMMILSLMGSMIGFSWRGIGIIGTAFLLLFIGTVIYTYRTWKREDAEKLESELNRIRDQLQMECKKLAGEVQREKQTRIADHLDQTKRALLLRIDDLQRECQQREQEQQGEARERARLRMRKHDQQIKDLQAHAARIGKLLQDGTHLVADTQRNLRETASRLKL